MHLADLLTPDRIRLDLRASDKWDLIGQLAAIASETLARPHLLSRRAQGIDVEIRDAVVAREESHSTGIGHGCALPHARLPGLQRPVACLAVLAQPVDFGSPDRVPVHVVCLLLVPEDQPSLALKMLAEFAGVLSEERALESIRSAGDPAAIHELIRIRGEEKQHAVTARSIMRQPYFDIHPDTPLTEVTRVMQSHGVETASVIERDGTLVGEINCDILFRSGLPEFFGRLRSVAFIRNFDPFDRYFELLKTAVARDVMTTAFAAVPETATLLEVIFELAVRGHQKVFVVREGKRIGVIDRSSVLIRVLTV